MSKNIILIGMPGAGKSTVGVILAKTLGYEFIDTDLIIQKRERSLLQALINKQGMETFLDLESAAVQSVQGEQMVIATGGSVIYKEEAMKHLKSLGTLIFLDVPYKEIERRIHNITTRGIAIKGGATLKDMFDERYPYYIKYKDFSVEYVSKSLEKVVEEIIKQYS